MEPTWECIIVGGGAAGLSAALVLGRARRRVLILDRGGQSNLAAEGIGGLLGYDGAPPAELYARGRNELVAYPTVELRHADVISGSRPGGLFVLSTDSGERFETDRVLLAAGMEYELPDLPGVVALWGKSVFHCPYCHGWELRDRALGVLGSFAGVHHALLLRGWSSDVVLLIDDPADLDDAERAQLQRAKIEVMERPVAGVRGHNGTLDAVLFADGGELARDGLLVYTPLRQRSSLATELGAALTEDGKIDVDRFAQTTVAGLYAAGDISLPGPHLAGAIADGSLAAAVINESLVVQEYGGTSVVPPRAKGPAD